MKIRSLKRIFVIIILITYFTMPINVNLLPFEVSKFQTNYRTSLNDPLPPINLSRLPPIDYDSLYYDWYHPKIEMLIITPDNESFINAVKPLMEWKNEKGVRTLILSNFSLYNGRDKAEKIRNMIEDYYQREDVQWVLLAGDATEDLIPTRNVYNPDTVEYGGSEYNGYDDYYKPTDFYYADLTGSWDEDGDGKWGESSIYNSHGKDEINWIPEVYVGRLPASDPYELELMVNKTINYEKNPYIGDWMRRMLLAGGISSYTPPEDETRLTTYIIQNYVQPEMNYTHLCEYTSSYNPPDPTEDLIQANFVNHFNTGYSTIFFAGHGNPFSFIRNPSNGIAYTNINAQTCSNSNMSSLIYAFACTTSPFDQNDNNIGEVLIKRENAGAIGFIGGMRITWYFEYDTNLEKLNRGNAKLFWKEFFENKMFQQGRALYDSKVAYMNSDYFNDPSVSMRLEYERKNVLTYCLLGDPELDVYTNQPVPTQNPFIDEIFEGQYVSITIQDVYNETLPNARLCFASSDGLYHTFYADNNGICNLHIPALEDKTFNVTITGHNTIPSSLIFTLELDVLSPEIYNLQMSPKNPNVSSTIQFSINVDDLHSGIESVYLLLSKDNFTTFWIHAMENNTQNPENVYECYIYGINPGIYSYVAIARDYANNSNILYDKAFTFKIVKNPKEADVFIFIIILSSIMGAIGITSFIIFKFVKKKIGKEREWELTAISIRRKERMDKLRKKKKLKYQKN